MGCTYLISGLISLKNIDGQSVVNWDAAQSNDSLIEGGDGRPLVVLHRNGDWDPVLGGV